MQGLPNNVAPFGMKKNETKVLVPAVRAKRARHHPPTAKYSPYLLREIVYCFQCCTNRPEGPTLGYSCNQSKVEVGILDRQVVHILTHSPYAGTLDETNPCAGCVPLSYTKRMDSRWDLGFIPDEQEYIQQRTKLQQELEQLMPVDANELERAADLLDNFSFWC